MLDGLYLADRDSGRGTLLDGQSLRDSLVAVRCSSTASACTVRARRSWVMSCS